MRRTLALLLPLTLVPALPAAPPEAPCGRMVLDAIEEGLREYHRARTPEARRAWLKKLARTHDPRVAVALGEALSDPSPLVARRAAIELAWEYMPRPADPRYMGFRLDQVDDWWKEHEEELRRRAQQLP
jgi:hypothetical protein